MQWSRSSWPTCAIVALAAIANISAVPAARSRLEPPAGWHAPTADELRGEPLRKASPTLYAEAGADFDGDGKEDSAALFAADDGMKEALFVKLSSREPATWLLAAEIPHRRKLMGLLMGISIAQPGKITAACTRGYGDPCAAGGPSEITLKYAGIDYFRFESASSIVYWDSATRGFKRIWTSD